MSRIPPRNAVQHPILPDYPRRATSDEPLSLNRVLGDLGAWLEETEHHRSKSAATPTVS